MHIQIMIVVIKEEGDGDGYIHIYIEDALDDNQMRDSVRSFTFIFNSYAAIFTLFIACLALMSILNLAFSGCLPRFY